MNRTSKEVIRIRKRPVRARIDLGSPTNEQYIGARSLAARPDLQYTTASYQQNAWIMLYFLKTALRELKKWFFQLPNHNICFLKNCFLELNRLIVEQCCLSERQNGKSNSKTSEVLTLQRIRGKTDTPPPITISLFGWQPKLTFSERIFLPPMVERNSFSISVH